MAVAESVLFDEGLRGRLAHARETVARELLAARDGNAWWTGELSASALSTATAVTALTLVARGERETAGRWRGLIQRGYAWLIRNQNSDGGWGDTTRSFSNISTTALGWAALGICETGTAGAEEAARKAEQWLGRAAGSIEPEKLVAAIEGRYGDDRTFSIPILTMCALCGRLGPEREGWARVQQLPFELAALPQAWFGALQLPVVSYALPALIAIGQVRHGMRPSGNPLARWLRDGCRARTLEKLRQLQPENGGFLEAAPLTSFVTMSLAALGHTGHPVVRRGVAFLEASIRADGSWPIDTNLATWVTTLAVNALGGEFGVDADRVAVREWLMRQQHRRVHPYTLAAPGGWAWTDLSGGVPDADDTAGAIVALTRLGAEEKEAIAAGVRWLLDLQNRDGGIPTFCRGWGRLPFDRSSPDITAHAIRAWMAARAGLPEALGRAVDFLRRTQRKDGTWIPLWFGNQGHPADENPVYGTTRVLLALVELQDGAAEVERALRWLIAQQNPDGGWSGARSTRSTSSEQASSGPLAAGAKSSLEETGLAVEALAAAWQRDRLAEEQRRAVAEALRRGAEWLAEAIEQRRWETPVPIGFYFAKLWYFERLYPLIFANAALARLPLSSRTT